MTTTESPTSPVARDLTAIDPLTTFPGRFAGRSLVITGGARRIGRAVARWPSPVRRSWPCC
jgi:hypothetical protein